MTPNIPEVVVAGLVCLDVIPSIQEGKLLKQFFLPGKLIEVGAATIATGGAVANTGVALHRLGISTSLMGKVGNDEFGRILLDSLKRVDPRLAETMIVEEGQHTSYSIVLSIPGVDRIFLHCPGANDTFAVEDIKTEQVERAKLFHFGYPPQMKRIREREGHNLAQLMERVKGLGVATSLDMAMPDPDAESGSIDWVGVLRKTLPHVDIFLPSLEEILFMLKRPFYDELQLRTGQDGMLSLVGEEVIGELAEELLGMGCGMVVIKLGESGLYLQTGSKKRLLEIGAGLIGDVESWSERQLWAPCFETNVKGTTGAGDCTIAGFLAGLLKGLSPKSAMNHAVAVGAFCVEAIDATSGVVPWEQVSVRVRERGDRLPLRQAPACWEWQEAATVWIGPKDRSRV
ncbi:carbohydrate kinase family protein [Brevibacillus centrosporus]|uniref:carbohydrate kinase family protein n=1 Tax=Brevibacillus centrosporus TaxID=54910 RepID=UPI000F0A88B5|nr:carbohydrate kinase family protein [Brevibacillus centrosporus]MEC2129165.1 carbohydrate kinase family protein [Brevibacillus centrosporus]RNB70481.1 carbohydrate kinase family protein [Brevibacillus centrosporus]GED29398.1 kinase [Brevibacillus centrosporus]